MDLWRVCVWQPTQTDPTRNGHPAYVWPHQGAGRVDDVEGDYLVMYLGDSPAGAVAEYLGNYPRWTSAVLAPPPGAPPGSRLALARYRLEVGDRAPGVLDLDDPDVLREWSLRPSSVVTRDRRVTQAWARSIHDQHQWAGVSWWSYRDPHWSSVGMWTRTTLLVTDDVQALTLDHVAVLEASEVISRVIERES